MFIIMVASLDDILVHSENLEQHLERLVVLQQFRTLGLKLNPAKCQLCKNKAEFLGYEILEEGIGTTTKSKTAAINETPIPKKSDCSAGIFGTGKLLLKVCKLLCQDGLASTWAGDSADST